MLNKKGQLGIVLIIFLIIVIIAGIIIALSYINKKSPIVVEQINYIPMFLKSVDSNNNLMISNYILYQNDSIISSGNLSDWQEIEVDSNKSYEIYCWNQDHYVTNFSKIISYEDKNLNASKLICSPDKIGKITVNYFGSILTNFINLNISTDYKIKSLIVCESHTIGVLSVNLNGISCENNIWTNISGYQQYTYPNKTIYFVPVYYNGTLRRCGNDWFLNCIKYENNLCFIDNSEVPNRLKNKVDSCFDFKRDIINESLKINFNLETFNTNNKDKIEFYLIDKDLKLINSQWLSVSEISENNNYIDVGAEDKVLEVK